MRVIACAYSNLRVRIHLHTLLFCLLSTLALLRSCVRASIWYRKYPLALTNPLLCMLYAKNSGGGGDGGGQRLIDARYRHHHNHHNHHHQEAEKKIRLKRLPRVLTLHLKRFKYFESLGSFSKLSHRVVFPLELRAPNMTDPDGEADADDRLYRRVGWGKRPGNEGRR